MPSSTTPTAIAGVSRSVNDFAGSWSAGAADAARRQDLLRGMSSAADTVKDWYNRDYARDLLSRWSWGGWGGSGSDGGYGSGGGTSDSGYGGASTDAGQNDNSSADAASQGRNASAQTPATGSEDAANSDKEAAKQSMEVALRAFQNGDFAEAQSESERAIRLMPGNNNVHEFRALCQFAQGKYQDAAATLHAVLAAGPGWNWKLLSSLYTNAEIYTKQLQALEQFVSEHPKDAAGCFVLAYHYLVIDARDAAAGRLQEVVKLQPKDGVSAGILKSLEKAEGQGRSAARKAVTSTEPPP